MVREDSYDKSRSALALSADESDAHSDALSYTGSEYTDSATERSQSENSSEYSSEAESSAEHINIGGAVCCGCFGAKPTAVSHSNLEALRETYEAREGSGSEPEADAPDGDAQPAPGSAGLQAAEDALANDEGLVAQIEISEKRSVRRGFLCCGRKRVDAEETVLDAASAEKLPGGDTFTQVAEAAEDAAPASSEATSVRRGWRYSMCGCCSRSKDVHEVELKELVDDTPAGEATEISETRVKRRCVCCKQKIVENEEVVIAKTELEDKTHAPAAPTPARAPKPYTAAEVKAVVEQDKATIVDLEEEKRKEEEALQAFSNQEGGMNEEEKFAFYQSRFLGESDETLHRWATSIGAYLTFDEITRQFEMAWSAKPLQKAIGFFSCPPDVLPNNKLRLSERSNITEKGSHSSVARAAWLTFARYAARYDGEIVMLPNEAWRTGGFGNIDLIFLQDDGRLAFVRKGSKPYRIMLPQAIAAVENSFRFQPKRKGLQPKWSLTSFATTVKSLSHALYTEFNPRHRIKQND